MKKLVTAFAACAMAGAVFAQVESVNVVGYTTAGVKANGFTMFGVNFEAVGGGAVAIQDYFVGDFTGGTGFADADNLIVWTAEAGYKNYYYGFWGDPANPDWDNKWYDSTDTETADTIPAGAACWIVRRGAAMNLTVSGQVKAVDTAIDIKANGFTMFSNPFPSDVALNSGIVAVSPTGGTGFADADNLIIWTAEAGYKNYYYGFWGDPANPDWDNKWYDSTDTETTDSLLVSQAAWYVRRGAATTLTMASPL